MPGSRLSLMQEKGQITIPAEIRRKLGLKKGDLVAFVETEAGVLITPREVIATDALNRIGKALSDKGIALEDLIDAGREIRGQLVKERYGLSDDQDE